MRLPTILFVCMALTACGCARNGPPTSSVGPLTSSPTGNDLAAARKSSPTKLTRHGPAPQRYTNEQPPAGVRQVEFTSGNLKLKGWLSADPQDGQKHAAVVFLHGGWAFGDGDWDDAEPFAKAGFVLFMPMLRAENGNPGFYESFLGEVDDAIAAGTFVARLPHVDPNNVFVTGHSVGAVLTSLTAMLPSPYKAAAAFDGSVDMKLWVANSPPEQIPYDPNNVEEVRIRNPMAFAASLRIPLRLYAGRDGLFFNSQFAAEAKRFGKDCERVTVLGNHQEMVAPAVKQAIAWFGQLDDK